MFVQDQLRRIGIDMQLQVLDGNLVRARFDDGDFDAIIVQVLTPERRVVLEDSPIGMLDEELAGMIARATTEPDVDTKLQLWAETGERYKSLAPAMFLHASLSVLAADKRLEGIGVPGSIVRRMSWRHAFGGLEHLRVGETTVRARTECRGKEGTP